MVKGGRRSQNSIFDLVGRGVGDSGVEVFESF